jgi:hypothetical protein
MPKWIGIQPKSHFGLFIGETPTRGRLSRIASDFVLLQQGDYIKSRNPMPSVGKPQPPLNSEPAKELNRDGCQTHERT